MKHILINVMFGLAMMSTVLQAAEDRARPEFRDLDSKIQDLKQDVLDLNRDLFALEEELLFPANTQVAVFLSMDVGKFFSLDSVQLKVNDKEIANHLYTKREVEALIRGGVQRLYIGNFKLGEHELVAFITGKGPQGRDFRLGTNVKFNKEDDPKYIELKIRDVESKRQPSFDVKVWD
ncbi:MAG: hypothetical protein BMS9Abin36_1427 [Gammaproteobacteria bacterium]|nr:MAG: hypothetical protein BMS9Abin36_1427 [Gammaproteobacteria bacterium]